MPDMALEGQNLEKVFEEFIPSRLNHRLFSDKKVTEVKIQCNYTNLKTVRKHMGINGGELTVYFHDNLYEIVYVGGKLNPTQKLYGEFLDDREITFIVESIGTWVYDNIESILQREEDENAK